MNIFTVELILNNNAWQCTKENIFMHLSDCSSKIHVKQFISQN